MFTVFGLMTNILVTAMLLTGLALFSVGHMTNKTSIHLTANLGGSAVVTSLTGMPTAAACFLLPIGVVLYTIAGGIKVRR